MFLWAAGRASCEIWNFRNSEPPSRFADWSRARRKVQEWQWLPLVRHLFPTLTSTAARPEFLAHRRTEQRAGQMLVSHKPCRNGECYPCDRRLKSQRPAPDRRSGPASGKAAPIKDAMKPRNLDGYSGMARSEAHLRRGLRTNGLPSCLVSRTGGSSPRRGTRKGARVIRNCRV